MDWNQSVLDTLGGSVWQQAKTHHVLKMLWVWLQLLASVIQLVSSLFFPISLSFYLCSPYVLFFLFFSFISKCFTGIVLVFGCQSLLSHIASFTLCACVLNHNPVNPTSNGVYWERYQTWPLGLVLWPNYSHGKQRFNAIYLPAFQSLQQKISNFYT